MNIAHILSWRVHGTNKIAGTMDIYFYTNDHVLIPRDAVKPRLYGSFMKQLTLEMNLARGYVQNYHVRKNRVVKVDREGQRCSNDAAEHSPARCITKYLEDTYNCTAYLLMTNKTKPFCQEEAMAEVIATLEEFSGSSEARILNKTGCLPHCERDEITIDDINTKPVWAPSNTLTMSFTFEDASYQLSEEYIVYDFNDFIADVGGYLGLLLGHSVLSMYHMSTEWFTGTKVLSSFFKCR